MVRSLAFVALVLVAGCKRHDDVDDTDTGTDSGVDTDTATDTDTDIPEDTDTDTDIDAPFEPEHGVWTYAQQLPPRIDPCSLADKLDEDGFADHEELYLDVIGEAALTFIPLGVDTALYECTRDGLDFTCADAVRGSVDENLLPAGIDATLRVWAVASGQFTSPTTLDGVQAARTECRGSDCDLAASMLGVTLPCEMTVDFTAERTAD